MSSTVSYKEKSAFESACLRVGKYMRAWAELEYFTVFSLGKIYGLGFEEISTLTRAAGLGGKLSAFRIGIVTAAVGKMTPEWSSEANTVLGKMSDLVRDRNMVAHQQFEAEDTGSVTFYGNKFGKNRLEQVTCTWSDEVFKQKIYQIYDFSGIVIQLALELKFDGQNVLQPRLPSGTLSSTTPLYLE